MVASFIVITKEFRLAFFSLNHLLSLHYTGLGSRVSMRKIEKADAGVCITQQCFTAVPAEGCRTVFVFFFPQGKNLPALQSSVLVMLVGRLERFV